MCVSESSLFSSLEKGWLTRFARMMEPVRPPRPARSVLAPTVAMTP